MTQPKLQVNDSIIVKPHVKDPDFNHNIGGWQGRISKINKKDNIVSINWDSITLKQMPAEVIDQCEEDGLDWRVMYLKIEEVELTTPRDSQKEVKKTISLLESKHSWSHLGEEGKRIQTVLDKAKGNSDMAHFRAWEKYLHKVLVYPIKAEVSEWQDRGPLRTGDDVTILGIEEVMDLYGILVSLRSKDGHYTFPLCDLEVKDKSSSNYQPIKDYVVWFANR